MGTDEDLGLYIRLRPKCTSVVFFRELQERLHGESTARVEDGRRQLRAGELLRDLVESSVDAICVRHVGANTDGFTSAGVDLLNQWLVVARTPRQEDDGVCLSETSGDGGALYVY